MSYQVWLLASQYFISSLGVRKGIDNRPPNHSRLYPTIQHNGVRITISTDRIIVTLLTFPLNRCNKTAFYPIFAFAVCTLLAQVVLTVRSGSLVVPHLIPENVVAGYTPWG
jgi:hypothetical protein